MIVKQRQGPFGCVGIEKYKKQECGKETQKMCSTIEKKEEKKKIVEEKIERNEYRMKITRGKV